MFKQLILTLSVIFGLAGATAVSAEGETYVEGKDYDVISPAIRTANPDKVEVVEFFWYGCGHCYTFEPMITQWKKSLPEYVDFVGSPAVWNQPMELHAKAYYAAKALDALDPMHMVIFQAMNVDRKRLASEQEIAALFTANGVSEADFSKAYNSFGIDSQVRQANAKARAAKITGTPEMVVNGKYRISTRKAGSQANMLKVANFLIEKERTAQPAGQ